jgi:hypothetical protein
MGTEESSEMMDRLHGPVEGQVDQAILSILSKMDYADRLAPLD